MKKMGGMAMASAAIMAGLGLSVTGKRIDKPQQPSLKNSRPAAMPEYYGFRKRPIIAEKPNGERVHSSVKNCLKQGWTMVTLPK